MDDRRVGAVIRELRRRRRWRQRDVGDKAGVSQQLVSLVELGAFEVVGLDNVRAVAKAVDATIELMPRWRGPELERLLDAGHAALVDRVVHVLSSEGWEVIVEWTFNHFGERGSADVVAWHRQSASLLVVEVKTRVVDMQALLASDDRKARLAVKLLPEERGCVPARGAADCWCCPRARPRTMRFVAMQRSSGPRTQREHGRSGDGSLRPDGSIAGVWLVRCTKGAGTPHAVRQAAGTRVGLPRSR